MKIEQKNHIISDNIFANREKRLTFAFPKRLGVGIWRQYSVAGGRYFPVQELLESGDKFIEVL